MMLGSQRCIQSMAFMFVIACSLAWCQENERRAVAEHQLMHDRGRAVQSLRRLQWLSNTIAGLHTARARSLAWGSSPSACKAEAIQQFLSQTQRGANSDTLGRMLQMMCCCAGEPTLNRFPESK